MFLNLHTHFPVNPSFEILNATRTELQNQYFSAGIHPQNSTNYQQKILQIEISGKKPGCLAIGEIGLDKLISVPFPDQMAAFEAQIDISEKLQLPVILHCVKAWNETVVTRKKLNPKQQWIFHGFRKISLLKNILDEGLMISIGTAALHDKKLQAVVAKIPDDRLFLETDNDPEHTIEEVYLKVAELKGISVERLIEIIYGNFTGTFLGWKVV